MKNVIAFEQPAREKMSAMAWDYYDSGALDEITLRANRDAWDAIRLSPRILRDVGKRSTETHVLGRKWAAPLMAAPMAFQKLGHPEGEAATARGARDAGVGITLSTLSTVPLETVGTEAGDSPRWFQLYVHRDRELTRHLVERAAAGGYEALCVTVDAPLLGRRERDEANAFSLPAGMELENLKGLGDASRVEAESESGLFAYFLQQIDPGLSWKDIDWLASVAGMPVVLKGVLNPKDVAIARDHGAAAVVISNHGGRQFDTAVDTAGALRRIADEKPEGIELLADGGIRRGSDILKALALGAKAVMIGRPVLWGLAVNGAAGVSAVLKILIDELDLAMALCGTSTIDEIGSSSLL